MTRLVCVVMIAFGTVLVGTDARPPLGRDGAITVKAQQLSPWARIHKLAGGGVTPEYRPTDQELASLSTIGTRRLRLINIDSRHVHWDPQRGLSVEWSPHLTEGLQSCRVHGWIPRIIIGQNLPDSLGSGSYNDTAFWAAYDQYVSQMVVHVVEDWNFKTSEWEVGNEMDVPAENWVAANSVGTQGDSMRFAGYIRLYSEIAKVINAYRTRHPEATLRIGGPAVSPAAFLAEKPENNWTTRYVDAIARSGLPSDFVSFHMYGNSASRRQVIDAIVRLRERMTLDRVVLPLSISEWGANWRRDAPLNFEPTAGAFAFEFLHLLDSLQVDDAMFLALSEFPGIKWPVFYSASGSPTHAFTALEVLAELHGETAVCTVELVTNHCLAAVSGDTVDVVFWRTTWAQDVLPNRENTSGEGGGPGWSLEVNMGTAATLGYKTVALKVDGGSGEQYETAVQRRGPSLDVSIIAKPGSRGTYGRVLLVPEAP